MSIEDIANQLIDEHKDIALIFAFNAVGKTRLSVAYKDATKDTESGLHTGVYYNAFSEDLFVWDNDEENDGANIRLKILHSSLNQYHSFLVENPDILRDRLAIYHSKYEFQFVTNEDPEKGIDAVIFVVSDKDDTPIKISRGEERIFVWCFFLALLDADGWANEQDAHIFIDDPVSSLDEHNIFITAESLFEQIEAHYEKKRIIITTHHIGLMSNLANRLTKGEKSDRFRNLTDLLVLKQNDGELVLEPLNGNVFLYHLHLLQVLENARNEQLYTYHFSLLRQLLEYVSSFLGTARPGRTLSQIGIDNVDDVMHVINTHSHKNVYYDQTEMMNETEQNYFNSVFVGLNEKYKFKY